MKLKTRKFKNKALSSIVRNALSFYLEYLLPQSKVKRLDIEVVNRQDIPFEAACMKIGGGQYLIEIRDDIANYLEVLLITLAHEAVHIKQYCTGELNIAYTKHDVIDVWKGKRYRNTDYDDQPWEQEAYGLEQPLYIDYMSACYSNGFITKILTLTTPDSAETAVDF